MKKQKGLALLKLGRGTTEPFGMPSDRRIQARWNYPELVRYRSQSANGEGQLANLSETGVFICTSLRPQLGEAVQIFLQREQPVIELDGIVRWAGRRVDGAEGFGAEVVNPPDGYLTLVRSISVTHPPDGMGPRRVVPRISLSVPVSVEFGTTCDDGVLSEISVSGALLEGIDRGPSVGTQISLVFALNAGMPFEIIGRVVRMTDSGAYAVQFEEVDPTFKGVLAQAIAQLSRAVG